MEIKVSFYADIEEKDMDDFKKFISNHASECIAEDFWELSNIGNWEVEKIKK